jgi:hypothetical protein
MDERPKLPHYDPDFCGKVVKGAACVCVGLIVAALLVLLLVNPSSGQCSGPHQPSAASLLFMGLPALVICNVALRWDHHYARKIHDSIAYGQGPFSWLGSKSDRKELNFENILLIDTNWLIVRVMAGWCLCCAIPLFVTLMECTTLSRYLSAFHF